MFQLVLTKRSFHSWEPGGPEVGRVLSQPQDGENSYELTRQLEDWATQAGGEVRTERETESGIHGPASGGRIQYFPQDWEKVIEIATYSFVSMAAFVSFANNAISIIKNLRDLSHNPSRSVSIRLGGKVIEVKDGDDLEEFVRKHMTAVGSSSSTAKKAGRKKKR